MDEKPAESGAREGARERTSPDIRTRGWASPKVEMRVVDGQRGVYALEDIAPGERLCGLPHIFVDRRSKYTIQIDERRHQAGTEETDDFFNHSCDPNCYIDFEALTFVAARPIAAGAQLSFNYLTSEWEMDEPFQCWCERPGDHCVNEIRGFRHLSRAQQLALKPRLSPYLRRRLEALLADDGGR